MQLSDLHDRLETATNLEVYPSVSPDGATAPYVIYNRTTYTPVRTLAGSTGYYESIFRIDVYDYSFDAAQGFADRVVAGVDDWMDSGKGVLSSALENRRDLSDLTTDPALSRAQVEFRNRQAVAANRSAHSCSMACPCACVRSPG